MHFILPNWVETPLVIGAWLCLFLGLVKWWRIKEWF